MVSFYYVLFSRSFNIRHNNLLSRASKALKQHGHIIPIVIGIIGFVAAFGEDRDKSREKIKDLERRITLIELLETVKGRERDFDTSQRVAIRTKANAAHTLINAHFNGHN